MLSTYLGLLLFNTFTLFLRMKPAVIIAINLYKDSTIEKSAHCKVYEVIPSNDIGDFFTGAMDFSLKGAKMRLEEGYNDAKNILEQIFKMGQIQIESLKNNNRMYKDEIKNEINRKELKNKLNNAIDRLNINNS